MAFSCVFLVLLGSLFGIVDSKETKLGAATNIGLNVKRELTALEETGARSFVVYSSQASLRGYDSVSDRDYWITETAYLEPWPTPTTSGGIVVRTGITSSAYFTVDDEYNTRKVPKSDDGPQTTYTAYTLFPPANGYMSDNKPYWGDYLPCSESAIDNVDRNQSHWKEDDRCISRGGYTGCGWDRQCDYRDGMYWCSRDLPQGRACWWSSDKYYYQPLGEPCIAGDWKVFCIPETGTVSLLPGATPSRPKPVFSDRPTPLSSTTTTTSVNPWPPDVTTPPPSSYPHPTTMSTILSTAYWVNGTTPIGNPWGLPQGDQEFVTIVLEPRPTPTEYPATLVQTFSMRWQWRFFDSQPFTTSEAQEWYTWILHEPKPTHIPAGIVKNDLPCQKCASEPWKDDLRCEVGATMTGCMGQCELRDGVFWCLRRFPIGQHNAGGNTPESYKKGRACWWGGGDTIIYTDYDADLALLGDPCDIGDNPVNCRDCPARENGTLILGLEDNRLDSNLT
ncbi:hypothetical protein HD806DRAFT_551926 [Xylariaceae sp. AK1471]|nr:hypothetical protein HD806DRAFT_551926 [Xylariaceae sp. AK1471]